MKKLLITAAASVLAASALSITAFADNVFVTVSDGNGLRTAQVAVDAQDVDGDGEVTINDALYTVHEMYYEGGAEAGYASSVGDYGLMLDKLWGVENGGSYGYYVNGASAMSLADPVAEGDYIDAFAYSDLTAWSDTYCYFDTRTVATGSSAALTLYAATFDENWNPVTLPVEGAVITVNGEKTDLVTDSEGKVQLTFDTDGTYLISAVSDTQTLVPPVSIAVVQTAAQQSAAAAVDSAQVSSVQEAAPAVVSTKGSPDTGIEDVAVTAGIAIVAAGIVLCAKRRK